MNEFRELNGIVFQVLSEHGLLDTEIEKDSPVWNWLILELEIFWGFNLKTNTIFGDIFNESKLKQAILWQYEIRDIRETLFDIMMDSVINKEFETQAHMLKHFIDIVWNFAHTEKGKHILRLTVFELNIVTEFILSCTSKYTELKP